MPANPYLNRTTIKDDRDFFGRRRELAVIFSRIEAGQPQSVSIVGERRIGKSSLLRAILRQYRASLRRPDEFVLVFLDLQFKMKASVAEFFAALLEEIALAGQDQAVADLPPTFESVRRLAASLERRRMKLVILLDEFEAVTRNPNFTLEVFSFLRSLPNNYPVSFLVTSERELQTLCHSEEIAGSPFFNIFHELKLGCFTPLEAQQLIAGPSQAAGVPLVRFAPEIIRMSGYFPLFLQIACCSFVEALQDGSPELAPDMNLIRPAFADQARDHFAYVWEHLSEREQAVCMKLSLGHELGEADRNPRDHLHRRGYVVKPDSGPALFSDVFQDFVRTRSSEPTTDPAAKSVLASPQEWKPLPRPGETVAHYRILGKVGEGGMGIVYKAEDVRLGRFVALKLLSDDLRQNARALGRFQREARAASALNHPHICTIFEVGTDGGRPFIAMELLEGQTLKERIGGRSLPLEHVLKLGVQTSEALAAAHSKGVAHRDVKPANIFIVSTDAAGQRPHVKILDFGLAKQTLIPDSENSDAETADGPLTTQGVAVGTVAYMSPEQARGEEVDVRTDLFSFGAVVYEMATGQLAFPGRTSALVHEAILNRDPIPVTELNAGLPKELERVVHKALQKDRLARYQTATDMRMDLLRLLRSL